MATTYHVTIKELRTSEEELIDLLKEMGIKLRNARNEIRKTKK